MDKQLAQHRTQEQGSRIAAAAHLNYEFAMYKVRNAYFHYWDQAEKKLGVPYFPNVSMGWDSSPRCNQTDKFGNFGYPFTNTIKDNTPENFRTALEMTKRRLLARKNGPRILNINCWNEWTEGSYLEPDTVNGMKYLEAVRDVFGENRLSRGEQTRTDSVVSKAGHFCACRCCGPTPSF
jgi:hypothetical protein